MRHIIPSEDKVKSGYNLHRFTPIVNVGYFYLIPLRSRQTTPLLTADVPTETVGTMLKSRNISGKEILSPDCARDRNDEYQKERLKKRGNSFLSTEPELRCTTHRDHSPGSSPYSSLRGFHGVILGIQRGTFFLYSAYSSPKRCYNPGSSEIRK